MTFLSTPTCNQTSINNIEGRDGVNVLTRSFRSVSLPPSIRPPSIAILRRLDDAPAALLQHQSQRDEYQNLDTMGSIDAALRIIRGEDDDILSLHFTEENHPRGQ